jgi:hypothetical protein
VERSSFSPIEGHTTAQKVHVIITRCYRSTARGCLGAELRSGHAHGADDWEELLLLEIEWEQKHGKEVVVWADSLCQQLSLPSSQLEDRAAPGGGAVCKRGTAEQWTKKGKLR